MAMDMDMDVSEGWSVVPLRDKHKGCNIVNTEEEMDSHNKSDQSLIGSFVYQRPQPSRSDKDLIGTPFIISQSSEDTFTYQRS